jgi:hypothetical protein
MKRISVLVLVGITTSGTVVPPQSVFAQTMRGLGLPKAETKRADSTRTPQANSRQIEVYADGNVRKAISSGGNNGGGALSAGALGVSLSTNHYVADVFITAVGGDGVQESDFGSTILAPGSGKSLASGLAEFRYKWAVTDNGWINGLRGYGSVSSARWQLRAADSVARTAAVTAGAVVGGAGLGYYMAFNQSWTSDGVEHSASVALDAGAAYRSVGGDVKLLTTSREERQRLFAEKGRFGYELGATVSYNGVHTGLTWYHFANDVPGYGRGQLVASFSVQSALIRHRW